MRYYLQWAIAYLFAAASAAMASLFGFLSSVGPYAFAKAGVLCLVAFAGCHGPAWASRLRQAYGIGAAFLGGLAAFACLIVTLWGGLGTMASGGAELRAERVKAAADAERDRATLARLLVRRQQLAARPSAAVRPLIAASKEGTATRTRLEAELATAIEAEKLDAELATVGERLNGAPPPLEADPEASAFSQLTGISVATSAALKALLVSLALEAAAMVAMLVAWAERREQAPAAPRERESPRSAPNPIEKPIVFRAAPVRMPKKEITPMQPREMPAPVSAAPSNVLPIPRVYGSVKKFAAVCVSPVEGERLEVMALLTRYRSWCKEGGMPPADRDRFFDEVEKIFAVEVEGLKVYCLNVRLAA